MEIEFEKLQDDNENESINELVTNKREVDKIISTEDELIQKADPIYMNPSEYSFFNTPFYSSSKFLFGVEISTFWANCLILWIMTIITGIALYYNWLKKFIDYVQYIFSKNKA